MKYIIMGLFSLLAVTTQAQVRGIVKDNTGEPVPGANVFWVNTGQGVTTKEDGSFSISKPSKSHMLVISFIGFQNDTIHVSKKNQELDITLREGVELNEVNVVSRRMGTMKLRSSVMNEEMISSAELSRAACCNLGESFVTNPSVDVSYSDAATGAKQIKLLGCPELMYRCSRRISRTIAVPALLMVWDMSPVRGCKAYRFPKESHQ